MFCLSIIVSVQHSLICVIPLKSLMNITWFLFGMVDLCYLKYNYTGEPELRGSTYFFLYRLPCAKCCFFLSFVITKKGEIVEYFGLDKSMFILVITILKNEVTIICINSYMVYAPSLYGTPASWSRHTLQLKHQLTNVALDKSRVDSGFAVKCLN